jgi:hypothetical protein
VPNIQCFKLLHLCLSLVLVIVHPFPCPHSQAALAHTLNRGVIGKATSAPDSVCGVHMLQVQVVGLEAHGPGLVSSWSAHSTLNRGVFVALLHLRIVPSPSTVCGFCRWGATFYTVGVALYICAIASTIINDCPNTLYSPVEYVSRPLYWQPLGN